MNGELLTKLNYKNGDSLLILNAPDYYSGKMENLEYDKEPENKKYDFIQAFLYKKSDIPHLFKIAGDHLNESGKLWFCYTKKSSKLRSDITRDEGWDAADRHNFVAVRQVAIDEDWSALRFKPKGEVKELTRIKPGQPRKALVIPNILQSALEANPLCKETFNTLSYTNKKEYINWISSAKKEETILKRLDQSIEKLKAGKKNPGEK